MSCVPSGMRKERCRRDAWASFTLAKEDYKKLDPHLVTFTHKVAFVLDRLSLAGAIVDLDRFTEMANEVGFQAGRVESLLGRAALRAGMGLFSPTNDNHIRELLYERLSLSAPKRTRTGLASVDKLSLRSLNHPVADLLIEWSAYD